jgi:hypothetical protein
MLAMPLDERAFVWDLNEPSIDQLDRALCARMANFPTQ